MSGAFPPVPAVATTPSTPVEAAERALDAVRTADSALARASAERSLMLRFARSRPTQATAVDDLAVEVCVVRDGRIGSASTNRTDPQSLVRCARDAEAAAEAALRAAGPGGQPELPRPEAPPVHDGHDSPTAGLDPAQGGAALAAAFAEAERHGTEAYGVWTAAEVQEVVASSHGPVVGDRVTDAFMKVTAIAPSGRSGYASQTSVSSAHLDGERLAGRAARKAAMEGEVRVSAGEYPVVLEPLAVGELLEWLGYSAFNGLAYAEGRSALNGRLGRRVTAPAINLSDSPRFPGTLPRAFDAEGVPKRPLPLIQDGVAHRVVHDSRSASLLEGAATTGHAGAPGGSPEGPMPANLVMVGGGAAGLPELCAPIERGVYVTRLWYTNEVRPEETLITGVTRDGTFLIEDGEISRPLADLRLTDSVLGVLERTEALTARTALTSQGEFYGRRFASGVVCPGLRSSMRFTA